MKQQAQKCVPRKRGSEMREYEEREGGEGGMENLAISSVQIRKCLVLFIYYSFAVSHSLGLLQDGRVGRGRISWGETGR